MIEAEIFFNKGIDFDALVETLKTLPEPIRPVYFAEDEGKIIKANRLTDEVRYRTFLQDNPAGFFLYSENRTCIDITKTSRAGVNYSDMAIWFGDSLPSELAATFLSFFAKHKPVFGYAFDSPERVPDANGSYVISHSEVTSEYDHRNCYFITLGNNNIESGIGRKLDKYIPGVYWLTLLSDGLLAKHDVELADLAVEAMTVEAVGDGSLHLLKFFENPEDWKKNLDRLDALCERVDGVFSRRSVEAAVAGAKTYLEYDEAISKWR